MRLLEERESGAGLSEQDVHAGAAQVELQYDAHDAGDPPTVHPVDPPVPVYAYRPVGVLDAWVQENGEWIGRAHSDDGRYGWILRTELRQARRD